MKMCSNHWTELKKAIEDRGLMPLVHKDGQSLKESLERQMRDEKAVEKDPALFDPLIGANFAIFGNAIESGGTYLMTPDPETKQPYCPLCEMVKCVEDAKPSVWIDYAADEQLDYARELGLMPKVQ